MTTSVETGSLALQFRESALRQIRQAGTADPVIIVRADLVAWWEGLSDERRGMVRSWIRRTAHEYGHRLEPRVLTS